MSAIETIIPIFMIIALGAFAQRQGFFPQAFLGPANRLVFYLAIPAMIFRAISRSSLGDEMNVTVLTVTLASVALAFLLAMVLCRIIGVQGRIRGTFVQSAFHGNLGYIGLAVIFYYMGDQGLARGSIIAGLIMILQNFLAVLALQLYGEKTQTGNGVKRFFGRIFINPVILAAFLGIGYAYLSLPMPVVVDRSLKILSGLALPMALLLIGASISFTLMRQQFFPALVSSIVKLAVLPSIGLLGYRCFGVSADMFLPGFILLAAPPATLTYIFAKEMHGDEDLAVATISMGTVISGMTYMLWLNWTG